MADLSTFPTILAIFFAEFHPVQGPKVTFEVPEGFITSSSSSSSSQTNATVSSSIPPSSKIQSTPSNAKPRKPVSGVDASNGTSGSKLDFESISEYIIPKPELSNRLVVITTEHYKLMGFPQTLFSPKYPRNALLFNLCFVFDSSADLRPYEPIVRKCARVFRDLEVESEFISKSPSHFSDEGGNIASSGSGIQNLIEQLMDDLNTYFECQIPINEANTINLKLFPTYALPTPVQEWQVPIFVVDIETIVDKYWDLTIRKVIPFINGVLPVCKISELTDVDLRLVKLAVQHLVYYGVCKLVDVFQFANVYTVTPKVKILLADVDAQTECLKFIAKPDTPPPSIARLFSLYCSFKPSITVKSWIREHDLFPFQSVPFDIRRFIVWGALKGILRRIHKYPILLSTPPKPILLAEEAKISEQRKGTNNQDNTPTWRISGLPKSLKKYLNGKYHYDMICCLGGWSCQELDGVLKFVRFVFMESPDVYQSQTGLDMNGDSRPGSREEVNEAYSAVRYIWK